MFNEVYCLSVIVYLILSVLYVVAELVPILYVVV